jgi:RHS repeat-associated protein
MEAPTSMTLPTVCATRTYSPRSRSTGKERDTESGNDYFFARYYSSAMGRFLSPDWAAKAQPVPYAKMDDPQTLNLYAYVMNNPLTRTDPTGHWCVFGYGSSCSQPAPPPPPKAPGVTGDAKKAFLQSLGDVKINNLTVNQVANVVSNEQLGVKPGPAGAAQLDKAKAAEANAVMNADTNLGDNRSSQAGTAPADVSHAPAAQTAHDREVVQQAYYDRQVYGTDTAGGREFIGNSSSAINSRPIGSGRQTTYESFGPFDAPSGKGTILIYNDPE